MRVTEQWLADQMARTGQGATDNTNGVKVGATQKPVSVKKALPVKHIKRESYTELNGGGHQLLIKPMSVNEAWRGKRFKTDAYKYYEFECSMVLPGNIEIPDGPLEIYFE
jgi:hypothetical protein